MRFKECRVAYEEIKTNRFTSDLPCVDLSCGADLLDCGGASGGRGSSCADQALESACDCFGETRKLINWSKRSRKAKSLIIITTILLILILAYFFYGRGIANVVVTDLGVQNQNVLKRFTQREHPEVRVLLIIGDEKIYSEIVKLDQVNKKYKLSLNKSLNDFQIDELQILDARLNVAQELLVVGQELEVFEQPEKTGEGRRFKYKLKRRWHF